MELGQKMSEGLSSPEAPSSVQNEMMAPERPTPSGHYGLLGQTALVCRCRPSCEAKTEGVPETSSYSLMGGVAKEGKEKNVQGIWGHIGPFTRILQGAEKWRVSA